jgi:hypothetical protein
MLAYATPVLAALLIAGCTPLGLWVYEEPKIEVFDLAIDDSREADFPIRISLQVSNPNDFEVRLEQVEVAVVLNGAPVVQREVSTAALFVAGDRQTVVVAVAWRDVGSSLRPDSFGSGTHRYAVSGHVVLQTPIGQRRIRFERSGTGALRAGSA